MVTCIIPLESLITEKTILPLLRVRWTQPLISTSPSRTGLAAKVPINEGAAMQSPSVHLQPTIKRLSALDRLLEKRFRDIPAIIMSGPSQH
jgi:hypothetical protein